MSLRETSVLLVTFLLWALTVGLTVGGVVCPQSQWLVPFSGGGRWEEGWRAGEGLSWGLKGLGARGCVRQSLSRAGSGFF